MPPRYVDILVVHCGGNDLHGTPMAARQLADNYISKFSLLAKTVVLCSVVYRHRPRGMTRLKFRELADAFNGRLIDRAAEFPHLVCWRHRHLDRYLLRSNDGVHFNQEEGVRFHLSLRRAVKRARQVFTALTVWVKWDIPRASVLHTTDSFSKKNKNFK